jgi:hypothetical protein
MTDYKGHKLTDEQYADIFTVHPGELPDNHLGNILEELIKAEEVFVIHPISTGLKHD